MRTPSPPAPLPQRGEGRGDLLPSPPWGRGETARRRVPHVLQVVGVRGSIGSKRVTAVYELILLAVAVSAAAGPKHRDTAPSAAAKAEAEAAQEKAREQVLNATPLAMYYYSNDSLGLASLEAHAGAMTVLAPQCYGLDRAGSMHGQLPAGLPDAALHAGLPLMPLVMNPGFDRT